MRIVSGEFILPQDLAGRNCHASHLLPLGDGSFFAVWFEGAKEGSDDVCVWGARRSSQGLWSPPKRLSADNGLPHWNPVLFRLSDHSVILFYKEGKPIRNWYTMYMISKDDCSTWSAAKELVPGDIGGRGPVRNKPIYLSNGWILAPASDESSLWSMFADLSKDNGLTWTAGPKMNIFHTTEHPVSWFDRRLDSSILRKKRGVIQPTFWESAPGHVHALMRSSEGRIFRAESLDYGQSWSMPKKTSLPNNNSGIDAIKTPDGKIYLVYNPVGRNWGKRYPIALTFSTDNGSSWSRPEILEEGKGRDEFSYPCIQYEDGYLYITYTHNRTNIAFLIMKP